VERKSERPQRGRREREGDRRGPHANDRPAAGGQRSSYWVGVGRTHGAAPKAIVGAITNEGGLRGGDIGKIEMFEEFSLVEIGPKLARDTMRRIAKARVAGRPLRLRPNARRP
jgi:ATP-dependent RNA helicase DeaD